MSDILPAQLEHMIKSMNDKSDNIWARQTYRDRLVNFNKIISDAVRTFDMEFKMATSKPVGKKRSK